VVMHFNPKPTRDLDNSQCHVNVGARGCGIASGMVVHQDYRAVLLRNELSPSDGHHQRMSVSMG